ncbi:hypothetical protein SteCoe_25163 [Stentor coeruleus]|uniref:PA14 domain-containing protein n=1 Tax=Stentor coeruleus TaxID=5963 RepID=A0A1R2BFW4_9CILI|nr:hypothetical protein SteCoe_25163 [Stentor coeruleus]
MNFFFRIFISAFTITTLVSNSDLSRTYDLTFFVISSTNDILTCGTNSPVNAVISSYTLKDFPALPMIWDTYTCSTSYHCLMTKYFFVPGRPTGALVDVYSDDFIVMKINDVLVSTVSTTMQCTLQSSKNIFEYIKPGLNTLYLDAYNSLGSASFGYRLTINTQLV